jgi:hypothetical protein
MCLSAGCSTSDTVERETRPELAVADACIDVMVRLHSENIPELRAVEVWDNEYGPGLKLQTAHYEIFTTLLEPLMLRRVPGFLESAYFGYNKQLPEPIETATKFTIYLFADREQWERFTKAFAGEQAEIFCKIKAGAYYLNGVCVTYYIGRKRTLSALGHEGWHQFNGRHFRFRLPSWLDEGVAMLFETSRYDRGAFYFEPGRNTYRLQALVETLRRGQHIPLKELIAMNPGEVLATDQDEAVAAFYSQSYALVRFLREAGYGRRFENYRRLLKDGLEGRWPLSQPSKEVAANRNLPRTVEWNRAVGLRLFELYVGDDFDKLGREYLAFCSKLTYHLDNSFP